MALLRATGTVGQRAKYPGVVLGSSERSVASSVRGQFSLDRVRLLTAAPSPGSLGPVADDLAVLTVPDAAGWRRWLADHHNCSRGVWLVLSKRGAVNPTRLTYDQALEEALCYGWIDGQIQGGDEAMYRQRFTPRRARSAWSRRNVAIVERLSEEGRMHPMGVAQVERAKADGRWEAAYAGPASMAVPQDLAAALEAQPTAQEMFDALSTRNRYAVLYRIETARRAETRRKRIERFVAMLARGETIYPQAR